MRELRYAERLCARTARLYRNLGAACTFCSVLGGSGALAALAPALPAWVSLGGAGLLALSGAVALTVRPADKAAANEADVRKYLRLRTAGLGMSAAELAAAKARAHESDVPEVEPLRDVAWNDVMAEAGFAQAAVPLRPLQRLLAALA